jgi:hypothetical protein
MNKILQCVAALSASTFLMAGCAGHTPPMSSSGKDKRGQDKRGQDKRGQDKRGQNQFKFTLTVLNLDSTNEKA